MAELLKDQFGPDVAERIAEELDAASRRAGVGFDRQRFASVALTGFDDLELTPRAAQIAAAMAEVLPDDAAAALSIVVDSFGAELDGAESFGMATFHYLPHVTWLRNLGATDLDGDTFMAAMRAQYEVTKRFTAEFSIRSYLESREVETLAVLHEWASDPSEHVRRLVSEGTRPRLPWAPRLRSFMVDPTPVFDLLELLRHDDSEYVRRSVANNLNDIAKDHPERVVDVAERWWDEFTAGSDGRRMVRHALRTLIKAGHPGALAVMGFGADSPAEVASVTVDPTTVSIGESVRISATLHNPAASEAGALVDLVVHFVKANGSTSPKVFKGAERHLDAGERVDVSKKISLRQHSTRTHHPGSHKVEVQLNGQLIDGPTFEVTA